MRLNTAKLGFKTEDALEEEDKTNQKTPWNGNDRACEMKRPGY